MKNWEVLQKKISEMSKNDFITFAKEKLSCDTLRGMLDINVECGSCKYRYERIFDSIRNNRKIYKRLPFMGNKQGER